MDLHSYDLIIINSSGGKDSLVAKYALHQQAKSQGYPIENIKVSHQDLSEMEWPGTKDLVKQQADLFGFDFHVNKRVNKEGEEESLLEYVERRGKWPSNKQRYCTSDFKRDPGAKVLRQLAREYDARNVLYVFGFRSEESPARSKKETFSFCKRHSNNNRKVYEYLPIHDWSAQEVWQVIKIHALPYHYAYDLGMPRLSCCFCIFSPFDALALAGKHNYELLKEYVAVEERIGHTFRDGFAIKEVKDAIDQGYEPGQIKDWRM